MATRGRKPFKATSEQEFQVQELAGLGLTTEQIAHVTQIALRTLSRHFQEQISAGKARAIANVARTLYAMAVSGDSPASTFFYLKTQAGWKEKEPEQEKEPASFNFVFTRGEEPERIKKGRSKN